MTDEVYDLLEHFKNELGASSATLVFYQNHKKNSPFINVFFVKYHTCVSFHLSDMIYLVDNKGYDFAADYFDEEITKILKKFRGE